MGLESVTYINDFVTTNPVAGDPRSEGDDHIRNIKSALAATFPGIAFPVAFQAVTTGTADAYVITLSPAPAAYVDGMVIWCRAHVANNAACTINVNTLGAKNIVHGNNTTLTASEVELDQSMLLRYNATLGGGVFELLNPGLHYVRTDTAHEYTKTQNFNATTLTDAATIAWDLESNQVCTVTLGGNRTLGTPTNMKDGGFYSIMVKQDATGSRTLAFASEYKFADGTTPTVTATANAIDILTFRCDGTNLYLVGIVQDLQ